MRKYINFIKISLVVMVFGLSGCYEQEVAPIVEPGGLGYTSATITTDFTGTEVKEGETITYMVKLSKPIEYDLTFKLKVSGDADAIEYEDLTIPAYATEGEMVINFVNDGIPSSEDKSVSFEMGIFNVNYQYLLTDTDYPSLDLTVKNVNDPTLLTIMFGWASEDDIDIVTWSDTDTYPMTPWGDGGATGSNPEFDKSIWLSDPVGTYYVNIMHWGAPSFDYKFTIGHPDGSVQIIEGTFDSDNLDQYTMDPWTAWGGSYASYRILKVVNNGTKFVVTAL